MLTIVSKTTILQYIIISSSVPLKLYDVICKMYFNRKHAKNVIFLMYQGLIKETYNDNKYFKSSRQLASKEMYFKRIVN